VSVATVAGAFLLAAGIAGCASPPAALGTHTARVEIDGRATDQAHRVSCTQTGWLWKIETLDESPGFTAMVTTGDTVTADQVYIRDLGGFTGTYGRDIVGDDEARVTEGTFRISGKAVGFYSHDPSETVSASFTIETDC
jgi:lipoprotein LpqH